MLQLFLSYASQDVDRVHGLAADLRRPGLCPWMDDDLKLAGIWNDEIDRRIANCDLFMPVLSCATQAGEPTRFFRKEWQLAQEAGRVLLPVRLEDCELPASLSPDLAAAITARQREDLFPSYQDGLVRILRALYERGRTGVFEETFSCLGPDNTGWRLGGWRFDETDSTGENSGSLHASASLSRTRLLPQKISQTAAVTVELPARPLHLRYRRRLRLSAPVMGEASFQLLVDGEMLDEASHETVAEDEWTTRSVAIPDRGERRAMLEFTVSASSGLNYFPTAEAWIDDLRIS